MESTRERTQISNEQIDVGLLRLSVELRERMEKHGWGTFSSRHEILGAITEEMHELEDAVRTSKDGEEIADELMDIAVGALFGHICVKEGTVDW